MFREYYQKVAMFAILLTLVFSIGISQQALAIIQNCMDSNLGCQQELSYIEDTKNNPKPPGMPDKDTK
jgi:hypothetical protein